MTMTGRLNTPSSSEDFSRIGLLPATLIMLKDIGLLTFLLFWNIGFSTAQLVGVPSVKISSSASFSSDRIVYTPLTQVSVFAHHNPLNYPNEDSLVGIGMLAEYPSNCSCPHLISIHSITTADGHSKFERADSITPGMIDHGFAGYMAPSPGYCGANRAQLIEYYSEIIKKYRYSTAYQIDAYYWDYVNEFRPVRVLGYGYLANQNIQIPPVTPYVPTGWDNMFVNTITVRFNIVHELRKDGQVSYVMDPVIIDKLVTQHGWIDSGRDQKRAGPISLINDIATIKDKCGATYLQRCRETYDPDTGLYRPINLDRSPLGNKVIVGDCGYYMDSLSCFPQLHTQLQEFYSFVVNGSYMGTDPNIMRAMYESLDHSNNGYNSLGFVSWYTFGLLHL